MVKVVLTGTSCVGKTTILEELAKKGYHTVPEAETQIVQELKTRIGAEETSKWIKKNYFQFKLMVGERQQQLEQSVVFSNGELVFYDRNAICYIGYCALRDSGTPKILTDLAEHANPNYVFFLERLSNFNERRETGRFMKEEEAIRLAGLIEFEYRKRELQPIRIPVFSNDKITNIANRVEYIQRIIKVGL